VKQFNEMVYGDPDGGPAAKITLHGLPTPILQKKLDRQGRRRDTLLAKRITLTAD